MKKLVIALLWLCFSGIAQEKMSVLSFEAQPKDMTARIEHPVRDQNNDLAALVIVHTTETGFEFHAGTLGISKLEKKPAEYWLYIPWGSKYLTIKHPNFGTIYRYTYPEKIEKGTVYILKLTTAEVQTIIKERLPQFININSVPEGADIYIDNQAIGKTTPLKNHSLKEGEYILKLKKNLYHDVIATMQVTAKEKFVTTYTMRPNFGIVKINSLPESSVTVWLDGIEKGKTPLTIDKIPIGKHRLTLRKELFATAEKEFSIQAGETLPIDLRLEPLFGTLEISTSPKDAEVWINKNMVGKGEISQRLGQGVHGIEISHPQYHSQIKTLAIVKGKNQKLDFTLERKKGVLLVKSDPDEAMVYLDGQKKGKLLSTCKIYPQAPTNSNSKNKAMCPKSYKQLSR